MTNAYIISIMNSSLLHDGKQIPLQNYTYILVLKMRSTPSLKKILLSRIVFVKCTFETKGHVLMNITVSGLSC